MRVLTFDTETTGLPKSKIISPDNLELWPHIIQLSYAMYDTNLNKLTSIKDKIIKIPKDVLVSDESINLHGITKETTELKGVKIYEALNELFCYFKEADCVVGHNIEFDINMLRIEILRMIWLNINNLSKKAISEMKVNLHYLTKFDNIYCTMKETVELCNIQTIDKLGRPQVKWPKLSELHQKLFGTIPNNLHNSLIDVLVTLRCFIMLKYSIDLNKTCNKFKTNVSSIGLL